MNANELWPFLFEVNVVHRPTFRERTLFVTIEKDGTMHWVDHSGRMGHHGGIGMLVGDGKGGFRQFRGDKEISGDEAQREKQEFTVTVAPGDYDQKPVHSIISRVGKPWIAGWPPKDSEALHEILVKIYWERVNELVFQPFPKP